MPAQELLDYIKQSLQQGVSQEDIRDVLVDSGWQLQDIEEAFNLVSTPGVQMPPPLPVTPDATTFFGPTALLLDAWKIYKQRWKTFVGIELVYFLASIGLILLVAVVMGVLMISVMGAGWSQVATSPPADLVLNLMTGGINLLIFFFVSLVVFSIGVSIITLWNQVALLCAIKDTDEGIGVKESYRRGWHKILSAWWVLMLYGLVFLGGSLLLFVPGLIFFVWFIFSAYIVIAEDLGGMNALLKSREYVRGRWLGVFGRLLAISFLISSPFVGTAILAEAIGNPILSDIFNLIDGLLLTFLAFPIGVISYFLMYRNLRALKGEFTFTPPRRSKVALSLVGVFGIIGPLLATAAILYLLLTGQLIPTGATAVARDTMRSIARLEIKGALESYYDETDSYPSFLEQLSPEYISDVPTDPGTAISYEYRSLQDGKDYELCVEFETKPLECITSSTDLDDLKPQPKDNLESQPYINNKAGFKIYPPRGWKIDESGSLGIIAAIFNPIQDKEDGKPFVANITIASESTSLDLGTYISQSKYLLQRLLPDYMMTEDREIMVGGRVGYIIGGTFAEGGFKVRNKQLTIVTGGKAYVITGTALEATWSQNNDLIEASLLTFELL